MLGRIAVLDMTPVARARFPLSITRAPCPTGSPARAVPVSSPSGATRRTAAASTGGAIRLDLPVTVH
jgi:hypothetical protein